VEAIAMISPSRGHKSNNPHTACHLGLHDWTQVRSDDSRTYYACRFCDHIKAANEPWWDFASQAGVGLH
jgi:hypothetical protein